MNFTPSDIENLIKIARDYPEMNHEDVILAVLNGIGRNLKMRSIITNVRSFFKNKPPLMRPPLCEIFTNTCSVHYTPEYMVKSKNRKRELVRIRQQYCLIAFLFHYTLASIGYEMGERDHATALHNKKNALIFYRAEEEYRNEVDSIICELPKYKLMLMDRLIDTIG